MSTTIITDAARRDVTRAALRLVRLELAPDRNNSLYEFALADLDTAARVLVAQLGPTS